MWARGCSGLPCFPIDLLTSRLSWQRLGAIRDWKECFCLRWEQAQPEQAFERCSGQLGLHPPLDAPLVTYEESSDKFKILDIQSFLGS